MATKCGLFPHDFCPRDITPPATSESLQQSLFFKGQVKFTKSQYKSSFFLDRRFILNEDRSRWAKCLEFKKKLSFLAQWGARYTEGVV